MGKRFEMKALFLMTSEKTTSVSVTLPMHPRNITAVIVEVCDISWIIPLAPISQ
jgi:hypothetical protein